VAHAGRDAGACALPVESALVVKLDSQLRQPTVGLTTTTRDPAFDFGALRKAEASLWRWLRQTLDLDVQYLGFLEWTSGRGTRSGGHRRPHLHHLVKGIPADHELLAPTALLDEAGDVVLDPDGNPVLTTELERRVSAKWLEFTADAWVVEVRPLRTPAGAIAYLTLHHHKREQAPPPGFTGRRLRPSKRYYERPIAELRELARELLSSARVRASARQVVDVEFGGADRPDEYELDRQLTAALVTALRDFRPAPATVQLELDPEEPPDFDALDDERARQELVERLASALAELRERERPELVYVAERDEVDPETGVAHRLATAVLGPVQNWPRLRTLGERVREPLPVQLSLERAHLAA
jgi:LmbE family N-acetylglucosaminyl deacetylase